MVWGDRCGVDRSLPGRAEGPAAASGLDGREDKPERNGKTRGGVLMTGSNHKNALLQWSVFITKRPGLNRELPPGYESLAWVPNSSTLIYGERDAVLVDTFLTAEASQALADWVITSGKNLTTIYLTHGHGDHFFGTGLLKQRFPHARAVARPDSWRSCVTSSIRPFSTASGVHAFPASSRNSSRWPKRSNGTPSNWKGTSWSWLTPA